MAKRKSKSNMKSVIFNGAVMLLSALIMIFYAFPHFVAKSSVGGAIIESYNGFETLSRMFDDNKASATVTGIAILIVFITAVIVFLLATINLLSGLGVIKKIKFLKAINLVMSAILALAGILAVVCLAVYINSIASVGITRANGWANITNLVLSVLACIGVALDLYVAKK